MAERDTSRPGPVANFVFAGMWMLLGVFDLVSGRPDVLHPVLAVVTMGLAVPFLVRGVRLLRARRPPTA